MHGIVGKSGVGGNVLMDSSKAFDHPCTVWISEVSAAYYNLTLEIFKKLLRNT